MLVTVGRLESQGRFWVAEKAVIRRNYQIYICKGKRTKRMRLLSETEDMANCLILLAQGDNNCDVKTQKGNTKVGFYIYECKTCYRRFPSFQALGGHRASHKKPKLGAQDKKAAAASLVIRNYEEEEGGDVKSHDCSICGSEFTSGQALGGHMRRHRASSTLAVHPIRKILQFDLNLPPPQDHPNFQFPPTTHLLLPTPSFVDCHY